MTKHEIPKHFISFSRKLFITVLALFLALAASFIIYQYHREKDYKAELMHAQLQKYNALLETNIDSIGHTELIDKYINDQDVKNIRVTVMDLKGNVVYDSYRSDSTLLENHLTRPEIQTALNSGTGFSVRRTSETTGLPYFYSATRYNNHIIRSALPYSVNLTNNLKADSHFFWFSIAIVLIMLTFFFKFTSKLGTSVSRLREFAKIGRAHV